MSGRDQQNRSGLELPLVDVTWRYRRVSGPADARRQAARIGAQGSFDESFIAKHRCHEDVDIGATCNEMAAQLRVAHSILRRRRSVIDTASVDLRAVCEQNVDDLRRAGPVQRAL